MRAKFRLTYMMAAFCALFSLHAARADAVGPVPVMGQPAPALMTQTIDNKSFDLSKLKGKVVVVNYWATWCPPCRDEMPALEAVWRQYHSAGLEMLAISADRPRSRGDVDQVMKYFTFPVAMLSELGKSDFGLPTTIPVTYVIDKNGTLVDILTPDTMPVTVQSLGDRVKTLLDAKTPPPAPVTAMDVKP